MVVVGLVKQEDIEERKQIGSASRASPTVQSPAFKLHGMSQNLSSLQTVLENSRWVALGSLSNQHSRLLFHTPTQAYRGFCGSQESNIQAVDSRSSSGAICCTVYRKARSQVRSHRCSEFWLIQDLFEGSESLVAGQVTSLADGLLKSPSGEC